jgi:hypothetical protein
MAIIRDDLYDAEPPNNYLPFSQYYADKSKSKRVDNGTTIYKCTSCGQYKPKRDFYKDSRVPCGIRSKCKKCYHKRKKGI